MNTASKLTEAECRAIYSRLIYQARYMGDPVKRQEAMEVAAAVYTAIQLYRQRSEISS